MCVFLSLHNVIFRRIFFMFLLISFIHEKLERKRETETSPQQGPHTTTLPLSLASPGPWPRVHQVYERMTLDTN